MASYKSVMMFVLALALGLALAGSAPAAQRCVLVDFFTSTG